MTKSEEAGTLSTAHAISLYVGALLGPSLLLLPGLAAAAAGPASILAWLFMLIVSGLLAVVFAVFGLRTPSGGGVATYVTTAFGPRLGTATAWCFLAGVIAGAPVVCLIGGNYVADLLGGGTRTSLIAAGILLVVVLIVTLAGARASAGMQLGLVGLLLAMVAVAVVGAIPSARADNWIPFLPHGWGSIGSAASSLMLSFVGWESVASLTVRLRNVRTQLPKVIGISFATTTLIYLALAFSTIAVLGVDAGGTVPLVRLMERPLGPAAPLIGAIVAVLLTLAAVNAYISGGTALATNLLSPSADAGPRLPGRLFVPVGIVLASVVLLGAYATGLLTLAQMVSVPTALFLSVYVMCTAASVRTFRGGLLVVAVLAFAGVAAVAVFTGWTLAIPLLVGVAGYLRARPALRRTPSSDATD
ncbi:APC family permease [Leifsonia poae]|uniref:APC family permease n=1 Tax=Leifsonia poae TaxID=110933 RepID=UPI001CC0219E|nr:amino acid permease [Leifsonia poae]